MGHHRRETGARSKFLKKFRVDSKPFPIVGPVGTDSIRWEFFGTQTHAPGSHVLQSPQGRSEPRLVSTGGQGDPLGPPHPVLRQRRIPLSSLAALPMELLAMDLGEDVLVVESIVKLGVGVLGRRKSGDLGGIVFFPVGRISDRNDRQVFGHYRFQLV